LSTARWSAANPGNRAIRDEVAAAMLQAAAPALRGGGDLLDAGCGHGWWLERLIGAGVAPERLHGIDRDVERVVGARRRAPGASVVQGDLRALPYGPGRFGAVFLLTVLSSVDGPERAVAEAWRVLAPGGLLVVWEPRVPNPLNRATTLVRPAVVARVAGPPSASRTLTVLPWLARRLGGAYPRLARVRALRTHRLTVWER
jgi:SAM-dependent methyltransferase